jgi:hypothetical protein
LSKTIDLSQGVILQHEIATPYSTCQTVVVDFHWVLLDHSDLVTFDYHLFGLLEQQLGGWWLDSNVEVEMGGQ